MPSWQGLRAVAGQDLRPSRPGADPELRPLAGHPDLRPRDRHWEEERRALGGEIEMLTVSVDLVFAQARWCGAADVTHTTGSAYMNPQFGIDYGVLMEENRLLGRAVFVIDREGVIRHVEYVRELTEEPDEAALAAARPGRRHVGARSLPDGLSGWGQYAVMSARRITIEDVRARKPEILRVLRTKGATNPRVFGSVARGTADAKSDVDLLVDLVEPKPHGFAYFGLLDDLQQDLRRILGRRVHVTELGDPSPEFAESVEGDAVPL